MFDDFKMQVYLAKKMHWKMLLYNKIMITSPFYLTDIFFKCTLIINYKDLGRAVAGVRGGGGKGDAVPSPVLSWKSFNSKYSAVFNKLCWLVDFRNGSTSTYLDILWIQKDMTYTKQHKTPWHAMLMLAMTWKTIYKF